MEHLLNQEKHFEKWMFWTFRHLEITFSWLNLKKKKKLLAGVSVNDQLETILDLQQTS